MEGGGAHCAGRRWPRRLTRRSLLAAAPLLVGCGALPRLSVPPTATPGEARRLRVARPSTAQWTDAQITIAASRVPANRAVRVQGFPIPAIRTIQGLSGSYTVVETDPAEWPRYFAEGVAGLSGEGAADLVVVDSRWLTAMARVDGLRDLGAMAQGERWIEADRFRGNALDVARVRGKLLALPLLAQVEMVFYDRKQLEQLSLPPPTRDGRTSDLLTAARRLTTPLKPGLGLAGAAPSIFTLAWGRGAQVVSRTGRLDLTEPATLLALAELAEMVREGIVRAPDGERNARTLMAQRDAALVPELVGGGVWWRTSVLEGFDLAPWPNDRRPVLAHAGLMVGIPRGAPDGDFSLAALRSLVEASEGTLLVPIRAGSGDLRETNRALTVADATAIGAAADAMRFLPGDLPFHIVQPVIDRELVRPVLAGTLPVAQAAETAQRFVDRLTI